MFLWFFHVKDPVFLARLRNESKVFGKASDIHRSAFEISLASLRHIEEKGVTFASHIDGRRIFMGPEESMQIQSHLGSTIAMAFDECIENPSPRDYVRKSVARTTRWLERCQCEMARLNAQEDTVNRHQLLFGINQGGTHGSYITPTAAEKQRKRDMMNRLTFLRSGDDRQSSEEDEALTRSFLVMSGGKMLWTSDSIPEGVDDGLLTAQEISRLRL